mgnify:CR=1 FL=1
MQQRENELTPNEVHEAKAALRRWAFASFPKVLGFAVGWGMLAASLFVIAAWLSSVFITPIKEASTYVLAGSVAFTFFASFPLIDFAQLLFFHRRAFASLEVRLRNGEQVARPPALLFSAPRSVKRRS